MKKMIRKILFLVALVALVSGYWIYQHDPSGPTYSLSPKLIQEVQTHQETYVALEEVAPVFLEMLVQIEDKRFYSHPGFDPIAIMQALFRNIKAGEIQAGGSTLTQQLAKVLFYTQEQTLTRKLLELGTAYKLEQLFTKDELLALYINVIYYGNQAYGLSAACETYFNKQPIDLSREEAAMLVGLIPAPSVYNPVANPALAIERQDLVLKRYDETRK